MHCARRGPARGPASPPGPAHRARRTGITPPRPRTDRLAARARPPGGPPGLGVHGRLPARRGRAARRAAGDHPLGLLRLARRQVPAGQRRRGADLRPGRERRHLCGRHRWHRPRARPGGRGPRPGRGPGHRQAAGGVPAPSGQPGPVQRPARRAAGQPGAAPRGAAVDRRPPRRGPVGGGAGPAGQPVSAAVRPGLRGRGGHASRPLRRPGPARDGPASSEDTADGVEQTARSCGYGTPEAMRRAFVRALGVSPGEYRRRFRPAVIGN